MALAGLKKQFNKANQYMSEKMGAVEGTKLTEDFLDMERRTDATIELVDEMLSKTKEYLQPNPATRAKMQLSTRVQGGVRGHAYAQPEGLLGETMIRSSRKLGENNVFAQSLNETGEALKQMAEIKFSLEDNVKQNFLDPLTHLQNKEIKDVNFHRKKLESRRLDFDCKKRRRPTSQAEHEELNLAQSKFEQSLNMAASGMHGLLQNQTEHINQLCTLAQALQEYHAQCATILEGLTSRLTEFKNEAAKMPVEAYVPKNIEDLKASVTEDQNNLTQQSNNNEPHKENENRADKPTTLHLNNNNNNGNNAPARVSPSHPPPPVPTAKTPVPSCKALYDFDPEQEQELPFKEGDIIELKNQVDDNWFEGTINGKTGMFPIAYVRVLVPLNK